MINCLLGTNEPLEVAFETLMRSLSGLLMLNGFVIDIVQLDDVNEFDEDDDEDVDEDDEKHVDDTVAGGCTASAWISCEGSIE